MLSFFVIGFLGLAIFVRSFVIEVGVVDGRSMEYTYKDSESFLVYKTPLLFREPKRGDIVQVMYKPTKDTLVKRIIGLPGEQVLIKQNSVFIIDKDGNTKKLDEPYLKENVKTLNPNKKPATYGPFREHEYFVLGDNRERSSADSRLLGPIPREWILGLAGVPLRFPSTQ